MNRSRAALIVFAAMVIAAAAWGQSTTVVSVPVSGQYWERAAGGMLNYSGVVTFTWLQDGGPTGEWPVSGKFVGQAWCVNTGAGYSLYGVCTDCVKGAAGQTLSVKKSFIALDGRGQPAFENVINLAFSFPAKAGPPAVTVLAFAGP